MTDQPMNHQLVMISGESSTGKSASLQNIRNQPNWFYLNCDAGKRLPFKNNFNSFRIEDPYQIWEAFDVGKDMVDCHGIVIDTATFMMDMFETKFIYKSSNSQAAWGDYSQFWRKLLQEYVVAFNKPVIIIAHTKRTYDEANLEWRVEVPVKGALKEKGLESFFTTVVSTKRIELRELEKADPALITITEDDEILGFKHVFQTRLTKATKGERIRGPIGMFTKEQTYMDNDAQLLLDHLAKFYGV